MGSDLSRSRRLHPTARRILAAARRLLDQGGLEAITLSAVAKASGTHKASIGYYFGDKRGLITVLADSIMVAPDAVSLPDVLHSQPTPAARIAAFVQMHERLSTDPSAQRSYLALLPQAARDVEMRGIIGNRYDDYLELEAELIRALGADIDPVLVGRLASLGVAVLDGLSIQSALNPSNNRVSDAYGLWARILELLLDPKSFPTNRSPGN